ncbi:3-ketoacyl-CoA thiolase with broad chain length specificity [Tulasnella sp. 408]|nr:3-ketoacyl-CoA thiolase with broad chain length specificity [Tulasnella sp. 408]
MWLDPKSAEERDVVVDSEGDIRGGVTPESPCKLEPAIKNDGSNHAGNASQVLAGAAAILLVRRGVAKRMGPQILCKVVTGVAVGAPPEIVDAGPFYAVPKALPRAGITSNDVDFYEINEALPRRLCTIYKPSKFRSR